MCGEGNSKMTEIELELEDSVLFELMKQAHEADITLNKHIERILSEYLDILESKS